MPKLASSKKQLWTKKTKKTHEEIDESGKRERRVACLQHAELQGCHGKP